MLSLRFQESPPSLLSYWSDNMSVGPNLPLHTLSKPAIRYLYRSQVRNYIKTNENNPLSEEMMEIFESYLSYKYISSATKCMIVDHLCRRLELLEVHRCLSTMEMVFRSSHILVEVLESPDSSPLRPSVSTLQNIAFIKLQDLIKTPNFLEALEYFSFTYQLWLPTDYRATMLHSIEERVRLLADNDLLSIMSSGLSLVLNIHDSARTAVFVAIFKRASAEDLSPEIQDVTRDIFTSYIGSGPDFSRQLLEVIALAGSTDQTRTSIMKSLAVDQDLVTNLLQNAACIYEVCVALEKLAQTQAASAIMLDLKLHLFLVEMILDSTPASSHCAAIRVLQQICAWSKGAEAIVSDSNIVSTAKKLLASNDTAVEACHWLEAIAQHKSTFHAILSPDLIEVLFALLSDTTPTISQQAAFKKLLGSNDTSVEASHWLGAIAQHKSTYHTIPFAELFEPLFDLWITRNTTPAVSPCAALRLFERICVWPKGAEAVVSNSYMLPTAEKLLGSKDTSVEACHWLQAISQHKSTYNAILSTGLIKALFALLSDATPTASQTAALGVLRQICDWSKGAKAVVFEHDMLHNVHTTKTLFSSDDTFVPLCLWLQAIAQHESTYHAILSAGLIKGLFARLRETTSSISQCATR
ncbi:hypothetical protein R3P38DRAFT_1844092 [Favolaschia claudopus]|uniref:Uncharacterized protein n=1 Tax=Favolaschia claudopus TaxID=2862362 RepID=A0AAW0A2C2_9AGAR